MPEPLNAMTVDLEDWPQSVLDPRLPITSCVVGNTHRVLELLDRYQVTATFFALGKVCERHPELLAAISAAGHEIASHGYGHELVHRLTPEQFRADVRRSVEIIAAATGARPIGYRAPPRRSRYRRQRSGWARFSPNSASVTAPASTRSRAGGTASPPPRVESTVGTDAI
jgi:peptidoglycan/xylan/chitin deacetylase (PgdA/CDA1 family)